LAGAVPSFSGSALSGCGLWLLAQRHQVPEHDGRASGRLRIGEPIKTVLTTPWARVVPFCGPHRRRHDIWCFVVCARLLAAAP